MYKIISNNEIALNTYEMIVEAPLVIKNCLPGQFVIVMGYESSERIPLTIYDYEHEKGYLSLIYQVVGASTLELSKIKDYLFCVTGPLGKPSEICLNPDDYCNKKIVYVAGGVGIAPVYPQVKYLKEKGINCVVIYGARNEELFLIKDKIEDVSSNVYYVSDDGSFGEKGFVTDILKDKINDYDICVAIGPMIMMKNVCLLTKQYNVKTIVSMNPLMIDGSGMCGACRCLIEGKPKFACIDGPEFDGFKVDFDLAMKRMKIYQEQEKKKYALMKGKYEDGQES